MTKSGKRPNLIGSGGNHHVDYNATTSDRLSELFQEFKTNLADASRDASALLNQLEEIKRSVEMEIEESRQVFEGQQRFGTWSKHRLSDGVLIPLGSYVPEGDDYETIALYRKPTPDNA
jgi:hypothetical protein